MGKIKGINTVLVILILVLLIGLGVCGYLLVKGEKQVNEQNNTIQNGNSTGTTIEERYKVYAQGMKTSLAKLQNYKEAPDGEKTNGNLLTLCRVPQITGVTSISVEYNGDVYLQLESESVVGKKYGEKYKAQSNAINAGIIEFGRDANIFIWTINEEGKVFYTIIQPVMSNIPDLNLKEIKDLKNIIDIKSIDGPTSLDIMAIDIDGNITDLSQIIYK